MGHLNPHSPDHLRVSEESALSCGPGKPDSLERVRDDKTAGSADVLVGNRSCPFGNEGAAQIVWVLGHGETLITSPSAGATAIAEGLRGIGPWHDRSRCSHGPCGRQDRMNADFAYREWSRWGSRSPRGE
jgi:hypothetical protein